jgi:hypothetical protein
MKYFCAGPSCPGYSYRASEVPHPPVCALPLATLTAADCQAAALLLRETHPLLAKKLAAEAKTGRGYKAALRRVISLLDRRVIEEPEHRESTKYDFMSAELEALYEWITDDAEDA